MALALAYFPAVAGCGSSRSATAPDGGMGGASSACGPTDGSNLGIASHPDEGNSHIIACSATNYKTVPPSSGPHYPSWPAYKTYTQPVPWGYLMHGLEHGAVVVVYNCPGGCPAEVAAAQSWIDARSRPTILCVPAKSRA